eukprot:gene3130-2112_t
MPTQVNVLQNPNTSYHKQQKSPNRNQNTDPTAPVPAQMYTTVLTQPGHPSGNPNAPVYKTVSFINFSGPNPQTNYPMVEQFPQPQIPAARNTYLNSADRVPNPNQATQLKHEPVNNKVHTQARAQRGNSTPKTQNLQSLQQTIQAKNTPNLYTIDRIKIQLPVNLAIALQQTLKPNHQYKSHKLLEVHLQPRETCNTPTLHRKSRKMPHLKIVNQLWQPAQASYDTLHRKHKSPNYQSKPSYKITKPKTQPNKCAPLGKFKATITSTFRTTPANSKLSPHDTTSNAPNLKTSLHTINRMSCPTPSNQTPQSTSMVQQFVRKAKYITHPQLKINTIPPTKSTMQYPTHHSTMHTGLKPHSYNKYRSTLTPLAANSQINNYATNPNKTTLASTDQIKRKPPIKPKIPKSRPPIITTNGTRLTKTAQFTVTLQNYKSKKSLISSPKYPQYTKTINPSKHCSEYKPQSISYTINSIQTSKKAIKKQCLKCLQRKQTSQSTRTTSDSTLTLLEITPQQACYKHPSMPSKSSHKGYNHLSNKFTINCNKSYRTIRVTLIREDNHKHTSCRLTHNYTNIQFINYKPST